MLLAGASARAGAFDPAPGLFLLRCSTGRFYQRPASRRNVFFAVQHNFCMYF
jgi:hypothetical protein